MRLRLLPRRLTGTHNPVRCDGGSRTHRAKHKPKCISVGFRDTCSARGSMERCVWAVLGGGIFWRHRTEARPREQTTRGAVLDQPERPHESLPYGTRPRVHILTPSPEVANESSKRNNCEESLWPGRDSGQSNGERGHSSRYLTRRRLAGRR